MIVKMINTNSAIIGVFCAALAVSQAEGADQKPFYARSRDLNLEFRSVEQSWCKNTVTIEIGGIPPAPESEEYEKFQQTLGRLRGAVTLECLAARRIWFSSPSSRYGEMAKVARWKFVNFEDFAHQCAGSNKGPAECQYKIVAYKTAVELLNRDADEGVILKTFLDTNSRTQLVWGSNNGLWGAVRVGDNVVFSPFGATLEAIAKAINRENIRICLVSGGVSEGNSVAKRADRIWSVMDVCRVGNKKIEESVIIENKGDITTLFLIKSKGQKEGEAKHMAEKLVERMTGSH